MLDKPNVFNIPANYHFFESLFYWAEKQFGEEISQVKFFLPNRRSCRELRSIFLNKKNNILPQIKAVSDISYEDFFDFLPNEECKEIIDELLKIKSLSSIDYLFFLSEEIQKQSIFGDNLDFEQTFKIAINLKNLFDEIEREEINLSKLEEIDDSNLSQHRLLTLDFLKDFHVKIKNSLIKNNIFFATASQNFIIQKLVSILEKQGSKTPIVIAGSTGSVSFSSKLISAISQKNYVILHGSNEQNFSVENHPQFFLNRLISSLKIEKTSITKIAVKDFCLSEDNRQNLISLMMLPSEKTIIWQEISKYLDVEKTAQDLKKNFRLIEARDELEEAKIIRLILEEALRENKKSAVITNNDKLAKLLKLELNKESLAFNDTRNLSIFSSHLVNFLLLILELFESDFNSHNLLAILKNPLCAYSGDKEILANFEINILRQDRENSGLDGIKKKLAENENLKKFFDDFCLKISDFSKPNLGSQVVSLIRVAENLSAKSWTQLLEIEPAQIELFEFFEKLKNYQKIVVKPKNLLSTFKTLLSQVSYFEKSNSNAPIQILSTIEARLLNYDLVVIASLNDGDFPENEAENWLGKKIKKDLEIDRTLKKVGQSSYDFCNYLSNNSVVLTRCKSNSGKALIESPFLLKLKTICKKIDVDLDCSEKYSAILKNLNMVLSKKIGQINPKPAAKLRPKKISITDISKLLANPYEIYAKKILQLKKLQEIDFVPSYAEFGSFIHKALEEFVKNPNEPDFLKKSERIFAEYFLFNEAKLIWWPKFENIFAEFLIENKPFLNCQNQVEIPAEIEISGITIRGKIDRAILNDEGFLEIFDYKTGQIPSKKDVLSGKNPQLTIAALMLIEQKIASLNYWKLSSSSGSEIKKICSDSEEILILTVAAKAGLSKLFEFFSNENNGYLATNNQQKSDYQNLMRQEEINK